MSALSFGSWVDTPLTADWLQVFGTCPDSKAFLKKIHTPPLIVLNDEDNKHLSATNIWFICVLQAISGIFIMIKYICKPFLIDIAFITVGYIEYIFLPILWQEATSDHKRELFQTLDWCCEVKASYVLFCWTTGLKRLIIACQYKGRCSVCAAFSNISGEVFPHLSMWTHGLTANSERNKAHRY